MVRSKRLKPISQIAQNNEKIAAKEFGQTLEAQRNEEQKLEKLELYRKEYLADMETKIRQGINGTGLQQYHQFLSKLDLAISQQKDVLVRCGQELEASQGKWNHQRNHAKTIKQVMGKIAQKEQQVIDKKEANRADEMSTQAFLRNQSK
ncbi:flagellar export protein FliJ [Aliikangiella sp. IMCC44359]|uniref:flagellar export protein FliJ n=1 Tax=Aliikangiella sp. IMCC44359 TaxID=3459125 RepID=UPI00403ACD43